MISRFPKSLRSLRPARPKTIGLLFGLTLLAAWALTDFHPHLRSLIASKWEFFVGLAGVFLIGIAAWRALVRTINEALERSVSLQRSVTDASPSVPTSETGPDLPAQSKQRNS